MHESSQATSSFMDISGDSSDPRNSPSISQLLAHATAEISKLKNTETSLVDALKKEKKRYTDLFETSAGHTTLINFVVGLVRKDILSSSDMLNAETKDVSKKHSFSVKFLEPSFNLERLRETSSLMCKLLEEIAKPMSCLSSSTIDETASVCF